MGDSPTLRFMSLFTSTLPLLHYKARERRWAGLSFFSSHRSQTSCCCFVTVAHRLDSWHRLLTLFLCCVTELQWLTSLTVDIVYWHFFYVALQSYSDLPAWQLTFFTDTLCCVVQSLRGSPIWQFTLFTDTHCVTELKRLNNLTVCIVHWHPLCYRAKETQQLDSLRCSLTPTVLLS